jgi:hypothetical protein
LSGGFDVFGRISLLHDILSEMWQK